MNPPPLENQYFIMFDILSQVYLSIIYESRAMHWMMGDSDTWA